MDSTTTAPANVEPASDSRKELDGYLNDLTVLLDRCHADLVSGDAFGAMAELCQGLASRRSVVTPQVWNGSIIPLCRQHPIRSLVHQDPYTMRAFQKPREYAGDAVLLDYIYQHTAPPGTSSQGRAVFDYTTRSPNALSVLVRRDWLAGLIDRVAKTRERPCILSLACGHLREAQESAAVQDGQIGAFYALDADVQSLDVVEREQGHAGVVPIHASVKALLRGEVTFSGLDLVYAAGLLDYLPDEVAEALAGDMIRMLGPGGTLLLSNFLPGNHGRGYMEAFMDWHLICRDEEDMRRLIAAIPPDVIADAGTYRDPHENIVFMECRTAA
jgi:SAM-dependent methyltransferase